MQVNLHTFTERFCVGYRNSTENHFGLSINIFILNDLQNLIKLNEGKMKKLLMVLILLCSLLTGLWAQTTVEIGTGQYTCYLPMDCHFGYNYTQSIYYKTEIVNGMTISKIAYNYTGTSWTDSDIKIYMGHTTKTNFTSTSDWIPIANLIPVFSGAVSVYPGWVEITLNTPFVYNGTDNLVIAFDENTPGLHASADDFYGTSESRDRSIRYRSDTTNPDPLAPPAGNMMNSFANIKLISPAATPFLGIAPTSNNFGGVALGSTSGNQLFTISNTGTGTVNISEITINGINPDQFFLTDLNTYPLALGANQSITVQVKYQPSTLGEASATLKIAADAKVDHVLPLSGTGTVPVLFSDDFESYEDFVISFPPWTVNDLDTHNVYDIGEEVVFPHCGHPMAYIIFNPDEVGLTANIPPHSGDKFAACIAAIPQPGAQYEFNNDWLISPQMTLGTNSSVRFWVRASSSTFIEKYNLAVSTTDADPASFTVISGTSPLIVPSASEWTEINYSLSEYDGRQIYFGIQCVSEDAFIFMVDDFSVYSIGGTTKIPDVKLPSNTLLSQNYPNPFNPVTTISFYLPKESSVKLTVMNAKGETVKVIGNGNYQAGNHNFNFDGSGLNSGVYFYQLTTPEKSITKKMILIK